MILKYMRRERRKFQKRIFSRQTEYKKVVKENKENRDNKKDRYIEGVTVQQQPPLLALLLFAPPPCCCPGLCLDRFIVSGINAIENT